jgi:hypothetical protein
VENNKEVNKSINRDRFIFWSLFLAACRPETRCHSSELPQAKKRSLHVVNEDFEPDFNGVSRGLRIFRQPVRGCAPENKFVSYIPDSL